MEKWGRKNLDGISIFAVFSFKACQKSTKHAKEKRRISCDNTNGNCQVGTAAGFKILKILEKSLLNFSERACIIEKDLPV